MTKNRKVKALTYDHQIRTLSIKCYAEQMPQGWDFVKQNIKVVDKSKWQVIGICHDRDPVGDNFWEPSTDKPHYHIIVRVLNDKRARVKQVLDALGVVYRPVDDKSLWDNHGVETCADFCNMTVYMTHDTEQAILDGKAQYELEELVSNLTLEEIKQIRQGYTRVSESVDKVTPAMLAQLDEDAYKLGCELGDFDAWYGTLPFNVRSNAKMKTVKESYERGINKALDSSKVIPRLCVYIESPNGLGKTHAARYALEQLGVRYLPVGGGGTGKFDGLKVTHGGVVIDDDACPNLLNMADTRYCRAYKRNRNNPPWVGEYLIVTSNLSFEEWVKEKCGVKNEENIKAAKSRFYVCKLVKVKNSDRYTLFCHRQASRGDDSLIDKIDQRYITFRQYFNKSLAQYSGSKGQRVRKDVNLCDADVDDMTTVYWAGKR